MNPSIDVIIESPSWERIGNLEQTAEDAIHAVLVETDTKILPQAEVSLLFCDDATIKKLNKTWRGKNQATNVLSFPSPGRVDRRMMIGDIAIAFETTQAEALAEGKALQAHVIHLIVHGFLHLLGHDHEQAAEAEMMENVERRVLARLGVADPFAGADLTVISVQE